MMSRTKSVISSVKDKTFQPLEQADIELVKSDKINEMGKNIWKVKYSCQPIGVNCFHHDIPLTGQEASIAFYFDSSPVPVPPSLISCFLTPPDNGQPIYRLDTVYEVSMRL